MLFISRNNKLYRHIAHMTSAHRYIITLCMCACIITGWLYVIHYPLGASIKRYKDEYSLLQKKYYDQIEMNHAIKNLRNSCNNLEQNNNSYKNNDTTYFKTKLTSVFDMAQKTGLQLTAYTFLNSQEKNWYKKEKYHLAFYGTITNTLDFLSLLKSSQKMITCNNISLSSTIDTNFFQMSCDIGIVAVI